ncbi:MAG: type I-U CRISPR-associated protein Cas5/Cas6 [Deltaproteobacteria bacterium]|nr:type I-U CRISPR-associated protein Cas5/Cas6 [Deltaproteobacteria bacterium]
MLWLVFDFPARRYHATPWGHHVQEGLVEWPPSPWRIVRALLATGYTKLAWQQVPDEMRQLVEALAANEPTYRLPPATLGHTRHYMPVKGWKKGVQATSLVIDAFVRPEGALGIEWPAEVKPALRDLLARLLERLGYLGRAESRVKAQLVSEEELPQGMPLSTQRRAPDDEPVRLLAPVASTEYDAWRRGAPDAPEDLLAALQVETSALQKHGWSAPPGSRELVYWRPAGAFSAPSMRGASHGPGIVGADAALLALATDRKRDVLPLIERALPTMELFRRALLSKIGDEQQRGRCPELTGKDEDGQPLQREHRHAHFIPLSLDARNRGRIDHVFVHAPMGLGPLAQRALRRLRKTWAKGIDDIAVTLLGIGSRESFLEVGGTAIPELASSATWASRTPFIPPRFVKPSGKDSLEGQVRAELLRRGLPDLATAPLVTLPADDNQAGRQARRFRHFTRTRHEGGKPGPPPGLFHLTLTLENPVEGPLCLGWGCHFGLGSFVPGGC